MKRTTLLLTALILCGAVFAQSFIPSWDLEKMQWEREQAAMQSQQILDKDPNPVSFPAEPSDAIFDLLFQFPVGDVGGTYSVATDGNFIYSARWNALLFHKYNMNGTLIGDFTIPGAGNVRDLTYDGEFFYGAPNTTTIYKMDFNTNTLVGTITAPAAVRAIAYDPVADGFWVSNGWNPPLRLISRTGTVLATLNTVASSFSGLGYDGVSPGGPFLWGYTQPASNNILVKINMTTGATLQTYDVANSVTFAAGTISGGMVITDKVYPGKWAFLGVGQNDVIWALELADAAPATAPGAPTNLTIVPAAMGALSANVNFTNPSTTVGGDPLTELTAVKIYRNDVLIHTVANPVIGGAVSYTDNAVPAGGMYTYKVIGENTAGEGLPATASAWIGPDVPAAPGNVLLVAQGNNGFITWTAPTAGLNGGYYTGQNVTYTVKRFPGDVTVATNISALQYLDNTVPGMGNYFYTVTASNPVGVGGTGTSNVALLGAEGVLLYETFNHPVNTLPPGWQVMGMNPGNWGVQSTANAGGTAPEMRLSWTPSFIGTSRLVTPAINSQSFSALRLKMNQHLNDYTTNAGEYIALEYSIDGGNTWTQFWQFVCNQSLPPQLTEHYFSVPENTNFHIAFRWEGNSFNINYWYFDNVVIEPVLSNDLAAVSISGNVTPSVGELTNYQVVIQNSGASAVSGSAYTVQLFQQGGVLIATVPGTDLAPAAQASFTLPWTPAAQGETYLYGYVNYPDDDVPGNNTTTNLTVNVQPAGIIAITIGTGTNFPPTRMPFDFFWKNSLRQTLYYASEIGLSAGAITAIKYTNNFATNLPGKQVNIWMGETSATNLTGGWIDPATLTLVYSGTVDFPIGINDILITLPSPYVYTGGNLVVYSHRVWEDQYFSSLDRFYGSETPGSNRTLGVQADGTVYDPTAPPAGTLSNWHPNTTLFFSTAGLGSLNGTVTAVTGGAPIEGVLVKVLGSMAQTTTNASGQYSFPALLAGTYQIEFSKYGWETLVADAVIVPDQTTTLNVALNSVELPQIQVSPTSLSETLPVGGISTHDLTIHNLGELDLIWTAALQYPTKSAPVFVVPEGQPSYFEIDMSLANALPGGSPEASTRDEVILNYDGPNFEAIGLTAGGTFSVAARFPTSMVTPYAGYVIESVDVYINNVPVPAVLKVWGAGAANAPGTLLHEQVFVPTATSWNTITLSEPLFLDGNDLWVGYTVTHPAGQYPAGCDAGPANPDGAWITTDGASWARLYELAPTLNYNWNIRARLFPGTTPWVSINPKLGVTPGAGTSVITVTFDASEVDPGTYTANIVINSNDPDNPVVMVPVTLVVGDSQVVPGDANCDGLVNVSDVIVTIAYILGNNPQPFCFENADVHGDGFINVSDVIGIINIILGGKKSLVPDVNSSAAHIWLNRNNITLQSDGTLAGLQFEIAGMEMGQLNFALPGYEFVSSVKDGVLTGLVFSYNNTPLPAGNITLFNFAETAGLKWGNVIGGNINAENVAVIAHQVAEIQLAAFPNPTRGQFTVEVNMPNTSETVITITDMMGREVQKLHHGILAQGVYRYDLNLLRSGLYFLQVHATGENAEVMSKHLKVVITE